jgi:hypothetical protein
MDYPGCGLWYSAAGRRSEQWNTCDSRSAWFHSAPSIQARNPTTTTAKKYTRHSEQFRGCCLPERNVITSALKRPPSASYLRKASENDRRIRELTYWFCSCAKASQAAYEGSIPFARSSYFCHNPSGRQCRLLDLAFDPSASRFTADRPAIASGADIGAELNATLPIFSDSMVTPTWTPGCASLLC